MNPEIQAFNDKLRGDEHEICKLLAELLNQNLSEAENKIWHRHPVWFMHGNPIVGYSKLKSGIRLMFWSGSDFEEEDLKSSKGKFKDAYIIFTSPDQIDKVKIKRWIEKSKTIQWDYKNIYKRKGELIRIK